MKKYIVQRVAWIFMLSLICLSGMNGCGKKSTDVFTSSDILSSSDTEEEADTEAGSQENQTDGIDSLVIDGSEQTITSVFVYVCGQVGNPGVYELPSGSRICDAIEAAGGMTAEAAEDYWNQAELLTDGEMIYIPTPEEAAARRTDADSGSGTGQTGRNGSGNGADQTSQEADDGRININTATKEELMTISGIGEGRAESIIRYRETNGDFETPEDIKNVSGIGDTLYESMKDTIKVN